MTAVDTNIVVRLLTGDDPAQTSAARALFAAGPVWIGITVLLETDWVLRRLYGFKRADVRDAFTRLLGLRSVHTENQTAIAGAFALTFHGIELADAIHLCDRPPGAAFVSFDRAFVRRAKRAGVTGISAVFPDPASEL